MHFQTKNVTLNESVGKGYYALFLQIYCFVANYPSSNAKSDVIGAPPAKLLSAKER